MASKAYPLISLLQVREHRENTAQHELSLARREKENAENLLREAKENLEKYSAWLKAEEKRRYDALIGKTCTKKDFDNLKNELAILMEQEIELAKKIEDAKAYLIEKEKIVEQCKVRFVQMRKDKEKIIAHKDLWQEEMLQMETKAEDAELEEFSPSQEKNFS